MKKVLQETDGWACFRICDTMGWGFPDPHAAPPVGIPRLVSLMQQETGAELEFHGHNDFGLATANSIAAWIYGCKRVNVAFGGMGERTGNTPLEQMVAALVRLYGDPGLDLNALSEMADLMGAEVCPIYPKSPILGDAIFTTQAGLHQTGVQRHDEAPGGLIYLPYSPAVVGRETVELHRIGGVTGMEGLVAVLNDELRARGQEPRYSLVSRTVKRVYDMVHDQYDGTWDEVGRRLRGAAPGLLRAGGAAADGADGGGGSGGGYDVMVPQISTASRVRYSVARLPVLRWIEKVCAPPAMVPLDQMSWLPAAVIAAMSKVALSSPSR